MNETEMRQYIADTFSGVDSVVNADNWFFFYNPDPNVEPDRMFPWVTLMTNDINDQFSNLDRPSIYRLNIGVSKQTFQSIFGTKRRPSFTDAPPTDYDFTALDQLMPHPVYGRQYWVSILNPSDETFENKVLPLLNEAYEAAVSKYDKKAARR